MKHIILSSLFFLIFQLPAWGFNVLDPSCEQMNAHSLYRDFNCQDIYPLEHNKENLAAPLWDGKVALSERIRLIRNAKHSIYLQSFIFKADETGRFIAQELMRAKSRGVDVRIIIDRIPINTYLQYRHDSYLMYKKLLSFGIPVQGASCSDLQLINEFASPGGVTSRYHEKMLIIDGEVENNSSYAILGGRNIANEYYGIGKDIKNNWFDLDVLISGPMVKTIRNIFLQNWNRFQASRVVDKDFYCLGKPLREYKYKESANGKFRHRVKIDYNYRNNLDSFSMKELKIALDSNYHVELNSLDEARFFHHAPQINKLTIDKTYIELINEAKEEILISNAYFIPSTEIINALTQAGLRGVKISILTNSPESNDFPGAGRLGRTYYAKIARPLIEKGLGHLINFYEWVGPAFKTFTNHAKFAIFDSEVAIIGSYNLDCLSQNKISEIALVFKSEQNLSKLKEIFHLSTVMSHKKSMDQLFKYEYNYEIIPNVLNSFCLL